MIDIEKLIEAANQDSDGGIPAGGLALAAFSEAFAEQLIEKAREKAKKNQRGHKSYGEHIGTAVLELNAVADLLRKHAAKAVPAEPIDCTAVNQLGAKCMRTDVHESHTYPPVDPNERVTLSQLIKEGRAVETGLSDPVIVTSEGVCGIEDRWTTHEAAKGAPDRCLKPPHGRDTGHEGQWSKWPWQDDPTPYVGSMPPAEAIHEIKSPDPATIAYLRGETDELGTPALVDSGGALITVHESSIAEDVHVIKEATLHSWGPTLAPSVFPGAGIVSATPVTEEAVVQPNPTLDALFDNALPDKPKREGVWMGGAKPVEPDPRPLWLGDPSSGGPDLPTSIRTTQVRMGEQCGLQYRLVSRDKVPEVPSWANIGGSALHACAQIIEQDIIGGIKPKTITEWVARQLWEHYFAYEISVTEAESPFGREYWRAANKGAEAEDWWNEVGPLMVRDYSAWSEQMHADGWSILLVTEPNQYTDQHGTWNGVRHTLAMELEMRTPLIRGELTGHLDQAWYRLDEGGAEAFGNWEIRVIDLKTGRELPEDDWQLEAYPFELRNRLQASGMDVSHVRWSAAYYDARNGKTGEIHTPRMDTAEIVYRAGSVLAMHANNGYPANPGEGWKAPCYLCPVRYACPIMATR